MADKPSRQTYLSALEKHVIQVWFTRSIDTEYGGFLTDFDYRWKPVGAQIKLLEFQARQTLLAADLLEMFPSRPELKYAVESGFGFLRDVMWDASDGGWYAQVDRRGQPCMDGQKHLHGIAYAIEACAAVYRATGNHDALELAIEGVSYIEHYAHDDVYGGYVSLQSLRPGEVDNIGTPAGLKDMNVHSDLFESFAVLARVSNDATVRTRLSELFEIALSTFATEGRNYFYLRDWTPASSYVRYGNLLQTGSRLIEARDLHGDTERVENAASQLITTAIHEGWDEEHGGIWYGRTRASQDDAEHLELEKQWWVQFEGLKAVTLYQSLNRPEPLAISPATIFGYLQRNFIDERLGGVFTRPLNELSLLSRIRRDSRYKASCQKATMWKDGSHEGRAWLALLRAECDDCAQQTELS